MFEFAFVTKKYQSGKVRKVFQYSKEKFSFSYGKLFSLYRTSFFVNKIPFTHCALIDNLKVEMRGATSLRSGVYTLITRYLIEA